MSEQETFFGLIRKNLYLILSIGFVFFIMSIILFAIIPIIIASIPTQEYYDEIELVNTKTHEIIDNPNVTCEQLRVLRTILADTTLPVERSDVRDMFNSMGCGNKWEWYED